MNTLWAHMIQQQSRIIAIVSRDDPTVWVGTLSLISKCSFTSKQKLDNRLRGLNRSLNQILRIFQKKNGKSEIQSGCG
jgi:hypothetical protein